MPTKFKAVHLSFVSILIIFKTCDSIILNIMEGELVEIDFPYPCNISRVTLRYGYREPSYNSANPKLSSLPLNQNLTNKNESGSNECSLHLTINPALRSDAGTYILTAYDENGQYIYDARVGLRVDYPPAKASCESSDIYIEGEWIKIHCSAPVGNLPGQILCYQNGMRLPPLTSPDICDSTLNQIILARLADLVYCCSSTLHQSKDRCECKDCGWDPILNTSVAMVTINRTDPCPIVLSSTHGPTTFQSPIETTETPLSTMTEKTTRTPYEIDIKFDYWKALVSVVTIALLLILVSLILNVVQLFNSKQPKHNFNRSGVEPSITQAGPERGEGLEGDIPSSKGKDNDAFSLSEDQV